jgi:hypothetical protein
MDYQINERWIRLSSKPGPSPGAEPVWDSVRDDSRFLSLLQRYGCAAVFTRFALALLIYHGHYHTGFCVLVTESAQSRPCPQQARLQRERNHHAETKREVAFQWPPIYLLSLPSVFLPF